MRYLISGGGTGGHIFPAVSIANALKELDPEAQILFVGALGRMEMERVPQAGYEIVGLPVRGFNRSQPWKNISVLFDLFKSIRMVKRIIREFRPDVGVGVGGYASGAAMWAASQMGIPILLQEQNSIDCICCFLLKQLFLRVAVEVVADGGGEGAPVLLAFHFSHAVKDAEFGLGGRLLGGHRRQ